MVEHCEQNTHGVLLVANVRRSPRLNGLLLMVSCSLATTCGQALSAIMVEQPHGTTITRVWESMVDLGESNLEEQTRQVSPNDKYGPRVRDDKAVLRLTVLEE